MSNNKVQSIIFLVSALAFFSFPQVFAADIPIEVYVEGGLTATLNGDWASGIPLSTANYQENHLASEIVYWNSNNNTDYIDFADDTATAGFYMTIEITDYSDGGINTIDATNFTLFGEYLDNIPSSPTKGYDDQSKNLSILPNSCEGTTTSDFTFHSDFSDNQKNYNLQLSNSPQTIITSASDCLSIGHLRFDRAEVLVPQGKPQGNYTATITLAIIDGTP